MANEKRLIDADKLMERFRIVAQSGGPVVVHVSDICATIEDEACEESVDAVEVVRCKDCKHRGTDYCIFHINGEPADEELLRKLDNDFCSYGERRTDV